MKSTFLPALVLAALVSVAWDAGAQPAPWQPERDTAGWIFTPAVGLGAMWDSNATLRVTGDEPLRQWVGTVNPRGELGFNGQRTHFDVGYSGALEAYQTLAELTRYDQRGRLSLRHQASPRLFITSEASLSASPTTDRLELGTLPFQNIGSTQATARGGASYAFSQRTSMTASYNYEWVSFDEKASTLSTLRGGHAHTLTATATHALTSRFSAGGTYSFERADTGGGNQTLNVQDAIATLTYQIAEHTTVMGGAGVAQLHILQTGETQSGPSLHGRLTHNLNRTRVELAFDRTFVPSWSFGGTSTNEEVRTSAFVPLTSRLSVEGGVAYSRNEPIESTGDTLRTNTWWTGGSIGYAAARWLRIEGFYGGNFQHSSARGEVDRTRIGIQLVTLKPVRIQ
jgi:hypothetical protein